MAAIYPSGGLRQGQGDLAQRLDVHFDLIALRAKDFGLQKIHHADKIAHPPRAGLAIEHLRCGHLGDFTVKHDRDAIRHGERLLLIVGHEDKGDANGPLQAAQF